MNTHVFSQRDREVLESIPKRFADAWNRHDVEAVFADYEDDAEFVNVLGMRWRGKERFVQEHANRFATIFANSLLIFREVSIRELTSHAAVVHGIWTMKGHQDPQGRWAPVRSGVLVFVARKIAGDWKIAVSQNTDIVTE